MGTDFKRYKSKPKEPVYVATVLGTGAGLNPSLKRRRVQTDSSVLLRPFKPPISRPSTRDSGAGSHTLNGKSVRQARLRGPKTYAEGVESGTSKDSSSDLAWFDENSYGNNNTIKKKCTTPKKSSCWYRPKKNGFGTKVYYTLKGTI